MKCCVIGWHVFIQYGIIAQGIPFFWWMTTCHWIIVFRRSDATYWRWGGVTMPRRNVGILSYRAVKTSEFATLYCLTANTRCRQVRHCHLHTAPSKECSTASAGPRHYTVWCSVWFLNLPGSVLKSSAFRNSQQVIKLNDTKSFIMSCYRDRVESR
jgi:hypothetical protein